MHDFYQTLGLNHSATSEEIRRAYRILARRYHPDVNPGKASEEKFKAISEAYRVLSDPERRRVYDLDIDEHFRTTAGSAAEAYRRAQRTHGSARKRFNQAKHQNFGKMDPVGQQPEPPPPPAHPKDPISELIGKAKDIWSKFTEAPKPPRQSAPQSSSFRKERSQHAGDHEFKPNSARSGSTPKPSVVRISVIEVSVSMRDAISGVKKAIEITEPEGTRKVSVHIPPGVRNGSVVHLRSKGSGSEDLVVVIRVASHPFLSIQAKGLVAEIPITINEAIQGASISIPSIDKPVIVKIPPASQSGSEIRLKGMGIQSKDGERGDLFIRLLVKVPESMNAVGFKEKALELEQYYEQSLRHNLPKSFLE